MFKYSTSMLYPLQDILPWTPSRRGQNTHSNRSPDINVLTNHGSVWCGDLTHDPWIHRNIVFLIHVIEHTASQYGLSFVCKWNTLIIEYHFEIESYCFYKKKKSKKNHEIYFFHSKSFQVLNFLSYVTPCSKIGTKFHRVTGYLYKIFSEWRLSWILN